MEKLEWNESWLTGVPHIDQQHRGLVEIINRLAGCVDVSPTSMGTEEVLNELMTYAINHLKDEEDFLEQQGYGDIRFHRKKHMDYRKRITAICINISDQAMVTTDDIAELTTKWWGNHILAEDLKWARALGTKPDGTD